MNINFIYQTFGNVVRQYLFQPAENGSIEQLLWSNSSQTVRQISCNDQYVTETQDLLKTPLFYVRVYGKTPGSQYIVTQELGHFCESNSANFASELSRKCVPV